MAMINEIRKRKTLLFIIIGIGMLGFLIPYDAVLALIGQGPTNLSVGEINGADVTAQEFRGRSGIRSSLFRYNNDTRLKADTWNDIIEEKVLFPKYEAAGITVSDEEYEDVMYGENISNWVRSTFYGGQPDEQKIANQRQTMTQMKVSSPSDWNNYYRFITSNVQKEKYNKILTKGLYANSIDAKADYENSNAKRTVEFVVQPLATAPDSVVTFTESDLTSYFAKHKEDEEYLQKESSSFDFVTFDVIPSAADSTALKSKLEKLKGDWMAAASDSAFVVKESKFPVYNPEKYKDDGTSNELNVQKTTTPVGEFFGPYFNAGSFALSKVISRGNVDEAEVKHIYIALGADRDAAKAEADSLLSVIKADDNFAAVALSNSDDPRTKSKGGELGYIAKGSSGQSEEFENAVFSASTGQLKLVETPAGFHIYEVSDKRNEPQSEIATITSDITASDETITEVFNAANAFSIENNDAEGFRAAAEAEGLTVTEVVDQVYNQANNNVQGLGQAPDVINWSMLDATSVGDVSSPRYVNDKYVVVLCTAKKAAGVPRFEDVKDKVETDLLKEKKSKYYADLMSKGSNIDEIAEAIGGKVKTASNVRMSATQLPNSGAGVDPKIVGSAFSLPVNNISLPIIGDNGVYVIAAEEEVSAADEKDDYTDEKEKLNRALQSRASKIFNAEKEAREVSDLQQRF